MKKTVFVIVLCAAFAATSFAQEKAQEDTTEVTIHLANEKKIKISDVPENVVDALDRTAYKSERVEAVFEIMANNEKFYKFIINDNQGRRAVVFDDQGTMQSDRKEE